MRKIGLISDTHGLFDSVLQEFLADVDEVWHAGDFGEKMGLQHTMKALADPIRREILNLLKGGSMSAGEIAEKFPVTAASISRHLSVLKEADLIRDSRDGKFIFYELNASVLEEIILWITDLKGADLKGGEEHDQKK